MAKPRQDQHRVLTIAVIIAVLFGIYFLRHFFSPIAFAAISAYLFSPVYNRFTKKVKHRSSAASLTLLVAALTFLIPAVLIVIFTILQINHLINDLGNSGQVSLGDLGQSALNWVNNILRHVPGAHAVTAAQLSDAIHKAITALSKGLLNILVASVSSVSSFITAFIIYIYVFLNFLTHKGELVDTIKKLNPLGPEMTDLYLEKAGATTGAMVRGQFLIALCQGFVEAIILQIAGIHGVFFFLFLLLTILSIIPLGGGIIAIPIGVIMLFTGNIWQGLVVLLGHFLIVTNIDNVLRPYLVPKSVRLNPALTLLAVFSGIAMFGFLGIVIGPVIMIILTLTIEAYTNAAVPAGKTKLASSGRR